MPQPEIAVNKMRIYVGSQPGGCTFELEPRSREFMKARRTDDTPLPRSIFIGFDTKQDFIAVLGKEELRRTVAELLTGMEMNSLSQIGGVEFLDPGRNLATFDPNAV